MFRDCNRNSNGSLTLNLKKCLSNLVNLNINSVKNVILSETHYEIDLLGKAFDH